MLENMNSLFNCSTDQSSMTSTQLIYMIHSVGDNIIVIYKEVTHGGITRGQMYDVRKLNEINMFKTWSWEIQKYHTPEISIVMRTRKLVSTIYLTFLCSHNKKKT